MAAREAAGKAGAVADAEAAARTQAGADAEAAAKAKAVADAEAAARDAARQTREAEAEARAVIGPAERRARETMARISDLRESAAKDAARATAGLIGFPYTGPKPLSG